MFNSFHRPVGIIHLAQLSVRSIPEILPEIPGRTGSECGALTTSAGSI
jgi:hypothetical protein